jgi:hypothetical protein
MNVDQRGARPEIVMTSTTARKITRYFHGLGSDGSRYSFLEWTDFVTTRLIDGTHQTAQILKFYELPDRSDLNKISDTEFEIVRTGVRVRVKT